MIKKDKWNQDEINYIKDNYLLKTNQEIADFLNRTKKSIQMKAIRLGLKKPEKRHYDDTVFESINNDNNAYWFGFIMADGTIVHDEKAHNYELSIELKKEDDNHLKKFIEFMKTDADVQYRTRYSKSINCTTDTTFVRIYSKKIIEDLINKNITPRKTFNIKYPKIEDAFFIAFLRGFFDGDGSIYFYNKRKCYQANITCVNREFLDLLRTKLYKYSVNSYITKYINNYGTNIYQLQIKGKQNAREFFNLIYKDSNIYLDRKYNLYLDCLNK